MDRKQVAEQFRQMATFMKVQSFSSNWSEIKEHAIIWGFIPVCFFILFRTYFGTPFFGWWQNQVIGGLLFCFLWFADQEKTGNFIWYKRIAHLAIAYVIASTYNLEPLRFK